MRPLTIKRGLQLFLKKNPDVQVLLLGFKIQYYNVKKPALLVRFGTIMSAKTIIADFKYYEDTFYNNLTALSNAAFSKSWEENLFET